MTDAEFHVKLEPVDSSLIAEHGYDPESKTLAIRFRNTGKLFHFANVPPEAHADFLAAPSIGKPRRDPRPPREKGVG